jgi:hypothetical protein
MIDRLCNTTIPEVSGRAHRAFTPSPVPLISDRMAPLRVSRVSNVGEKFGECFSVERYR